MHVFLRTMINCLVSTLKTFFQDVAYSGCEDSNCKPGICPQREREAIDSLHSPDNDSFRHQPYSKDNYFFLIVGTLTAILIARFKKRLILI